MIDNFCVKPPADKTVQKLLEHVFLCCNQKSLLSLLQHTFFCSSSIRLQICKIRASRMTADYEGWLHLKRICFNIHSIHSGFRYIIWLSKWLDGANEKRFPDFWPSSLIFFQNSISFAFLSKTGPLRPLSFMDTLYLLTYQLSNSALIKLMVSFSLLLLCSTLV